MYFVAGHVFLIKLLHFFGTKVSQDLKLQLNSIGSIISEPKPLHKNVGKTPIIFSFKNLSHSNILIKKNCHLYP